MFHLKGHLENLKQLIHLNFNITVDDNYSMNIAFENSHLPIIKLLKLFIKS